MFWSMFKASIFDNWPILTIFFIALVLVRLFYFKSHREKFSFYKEFLNIASILYILLLFSLLTKSEINNAGGLNLRPFAEILRYSFGSRLFLKNVVGNILIFIPFGFFISNYIKPKNIWPIIITSFFVSMSTELVQYKIGRSLDIDDILLNLIGGILGYIIYAIFRTIKKHLPSIFQKDGLYNIICIIIILALVIYLLKITGGF